MGNRKRELHSPHRTSYPSSSSDCVAGALDLARLRYYRYFGWCGGTVWLHREMGAGAFDMVVAVASNGQKEEEEEEAAVEQRGRCCWRSAK